MWTILRALLRRRILYLLYGFLIAVPFSLMSLALPDAGNSILSTPWPLFTGACILSIAALAWLTQSKLLFTLPMSRRQLGRTFWIAGVLGPAIYLGVAAAIAWTMARAAGSP